MSVHAGFVLAKINAIIFFNYLPCRKALSSVVVIRSRLLIIELPCLHPLLEGEEVSPIDSGGFECSFAIEGDLHEREANEK